MVVNISPPPPILPLILQRRSTDEYMPLPSTALDRRVIVQVRAQGPVCATRLGLSLGEYWSSRQGTAAALRALDDAWGGGFYHVPREATLDRAAADAVLGGDQLVIDVQTQRLRPAHRPNALTEYGVHFHQERPHQGKDNVVLMPAPRQAGAGQGPLRCGERLGGLLKYYYREAA